MYLLYNYMYILSSKSNMRTLILFTKFLAFKFFKPMIRETPYFFCIYHWNGSLPAKVSFLPRNCSTRWVRPWIKLKNCKNTSAESRRTIVRWWRKILRGSTPGLPSSSWSWSQLACSKSSWFAACSTKGPHCTGYGSADTPALSVLHQPAVETVCEIQNGGVLCSALWNSWENVMIPRYLCFMCFSTRVTRKCA